MSRKEREVLRTRHFGQVQEKGGKECGARVRRESREVEKIDEAKGGCWKLCKQDIVVERELKSAAKMSATS